MRFLQTSRPFVLALAAVAVAASSPASAQNGQIDITRMQTYTPHRNSSADPTGGNIDKVRIPAGQTLTLIDTDGPGSITHFWMTLSSGGTTDHLLKKLVLRMYWDGETDPSVLTTLGDFFGEHFGDNTPWASEFLSVGADRALNCFFPMPFRRHARITITNEAPQPTSSIYFNLDYVTYEKQLPPDTLYFHAQYRQEVPTKGITDQWRINKDADNLKNLDGKGNFNWLTATGEGQYVGVVMSVLQNQSQWWGEGDDMFFIDGATRPQIAGTGTEDYFLGAFDFWPGVAMQPRSGIFRMGDEHIGSRYSMYRFHTEEPIPFHKSIVAGVEHGSANHRSDSYMATAYWYQKNPHAPLPPLPPISDRIPEIQLVGGPGVITPSGGEPGKGNDNPGHRTGDDLLRR